MKKLISALALCLFGGLVACEARDPTRGPQTPGTGEDTRAGDFERVEQEQEGWESGTPVGSGGGTPPGGEGIR